MVYGKAKLSSKKLLFLLKLAKSSKIWYNTPIFKKGVLNMAREGFLTYLENYFKKHEIGLKKVPFELNSVNKMFTLAAEQIIASKMEPDVSILRKKGFIKVDERGTMYIELESYQNIRVVIANDYVMNPKKAIYITETDFEKEMMAMHYNTYQMLKEKYGLGSLLKDNFQEAPCVSHIVKEDFKVLATTARKKWQSEKEAKQKEEHDQWMSRVQSVYFIDPEVSETTRRANISSTVSECKHEDLPLYERHQIMMDLGPEKAVQAQGLNGNNSSYFACLYRIDQKENKRIYALIMEPNSSYGYTKAAYFQSDEEVTDEEFQQKVVEYLQYPADVFHSLANTTRFCHKSMDFYKNVFDEVLFDEYKSPDHKKKLILAKTTAEEFKNKR